MRREQLNERVVDVGVRQAVSRSYWLVDEVSIVRVESELESTVCQQCILPTSIGNGARVGECSVGQRLRRRVRQSSRHVWHAVEQ